MKQFTLPSPYDGLALSAACCLPAGTPKAIVQFSHGMAEHKERYFPFMEYLCAQGYLCVIHDHRGHGGSVKSTADYGYFYTEDITAVVEDLHAVGETVRREYPDLPLILFSHSMGTLVARSYLKKYDGLVSKVVLCGPPTENKAVGLGLLLARLSPKRKARTPNRLLDGIAFSSFNKGCDRPFGWLSANPDNVAAYCADPLCGFVFTTNGFLNLFALQQDAFRTDNWKVTAPALPILVIAGENDPVIISKKNFDGLTKFLGQLGYSKVEAKLYPGKRHELLNETGREEIFADVLRFFEEG